VAFLSLGQIFATSVDVNTAKKYAKSFAKANIASAKSITDVSLAYTVTNESGKACVYVFNFENGFVMMSADDAAKPILGFSDEGRFDANAIADGLDYYLNYYKRTITNLIDTRAVATEDIASEWSFLRETGKINAKNEVRGVDPLISTLWNQDYPYNYYCPTNQGGPGGRAYAGCVATAMSMVMRFWNHPSQGTGSHSYIPSGYPEQSANFGETTYDWANMPLGISQSSQPAQIQAVAKLMYHCGVAVDMGYGPSGSGAHSIDVPDALEDYFSYSRMTSYRSRDVYTKTQWEDLLIDSFNEGFPVYYSGANDEYGHAFVCDGYNDNRYFHFNWGWSGQGNGFFAIDALNVPGSTFNEHQTAIFDIVPDYVYEALPATPSDFTVEPETPYSFTAVVSWTNPSKSLSNANLQTIDQIVVMREGEIIHTEENVNPGEAMSFIDEVAQYDIYHYEIYAVTSVGKGRRMATSAQFGPLCEWKLMGMTTNFQGWNGGKVSVVNAHGNTIKEFSMTSSGSLNEFVAIPEGDVAFTWTAPSAPVASMNIIIKDASNQTVYTYSGASSGIAAGTLCTVDNQCDGCKSPENLEGEYSYENGRYGTLLSWAIGENTPEKYFIYRSESDALYEKVAEVDGSNTSYLDEIEAGNYYYQVTAKYASCESQPAMTTDMTKDYVIVTVTDVQAFSEEGVSVYPNPANTNFFIEGENLQKVTVYNMVGQVVVEKDCESNNVSIDASNLKSGVYLIRLDTEEGIISRVISVTR
jgi:Peptidase C10 family.